MQEIRGFLDSSVDKESACSAGNQGSILGSRRSPGEGIGYPLQYSLASLVAQLVKNLPTMQETWVRSLGWEDPLEKGKAQFSSVSQSCLTLCNPMDCSTPGVPIHHQLLGVYPNSCPWSRCCHPTISSSVVPSSFCLQSFPALGSSR